MTVRSLNGYTVTRDGTRWRVALGALVSRQHLEPGLEIRFPAGKRDEAATVTLSLDDADGALDDTTIDLTYRYAGDRENDRQPRDVEVDRHVARLYASTVRRDALRLNRDGRYGEAHTAMLACADRIAGYAGEDPEIHETLSSVRSGANQYREKMPMRARKRAYSSSTYSMKMRSKRGASLRGVGRGSLVMQPLLPETHELVEKVVRNAHPALHGLFAAVDVSRGLLGTCEEEERAGGELSQREEARLVEAAARASANPDVRIVNTCRHLEDNWFSHWHAPQRTAVSSLFAWDRTAAVAVEAFVAYEILLYGLHGLAPGYETVAMAHEETRGCLFDFCGLRADIEIKLQTMDLCPACERGLGRLRINLDAVRGLCETVRELARPAARGARTGAEQRPRP